MTGFLTKLPVNTRKGEWLVRVPSGQIFGPFLRAVLMEAFKKQSWHVDWELIPSFEHHFPMRDRKELSGYFPGIYPELVDDRETDTLRGTTIQMPPSFIPAPPLSPAEPDISKPSGFSTFLLWTLGTFVAATMVTISLLLTW